MITLRLYKILKQIIYKINILNKNKIEIVKLWENASPTSSFAAQAVSIDSLQDGDLIMIIGRYSTGAYDGFTGFYETSVGTTGCIAISASANVVRNFTIKNNSIQFDAGEKYSSYAGGSSTNNGNAIPTAIYGIKGVL